MLESSVPLISIFGLLYRLLELDRGYSSTVFEIRNHFIDGNAVATLMKTVACVSFTMIKHRGANFLQFVAIIGGHSPFHLPMLLEGVDLCSFNFLYFNC